MQDSENKNPIEELNSPDKPHLYQGVKLDEILILQDIPLNPKIRVMRGVVTSVLNERIGIIEQVSEQQRINGIKASLGQVSGGHYHPCGINFLAEVSDYATIVQKLNFDPILTAKLIALREYTQLTTATLIFMDTLNPKFDTFIHLPPDKLSTALEEGYYGMEYPDTIPAELIPLKDKMINIFLSFMQNSSIQQNLEGYDQLKWSIAFRQLIDGDREDMVEAMDFIQDINVPYTEAVVEYLDVSHLTG